MRFSKKLFSVLAAGSALLLLGLTGCGKAAGYQQMSMEDAKQWMQENEGFALVDVRTPEEYAEGFIPGAVNLPLDTIGADPILTLPDKAQTILVYCRSGNRSKTAAGRLVEQGYTHIIEIGGIRDWPDPLAMP